MKHTITGCIALLCMALTAYAEAPPVAFDTLLEEAGLSYTPPPGFHEIPPRPVYVLPYEKRLLADDGSLELRYAIRPLGRIEIDYEDPHNAAPEPNDLFEMLFRTLSETLAGKSHVYSRALLPADARREYHAGWAAIGVFDIVPEIGKPFRQAMLIALHQNDKADAYLLFLTNDLKAAKNKIEAARHSLRFTKFDNDIHRPPSPEELKQLPMIRK